MILTDTGPLYALVNPGDAYHARCVAVWSNLGGDVLFTTWPCFTEAMHLAGRSREYRYQATLWEMQLSGQVRIHSNTDLEAGRMRYLMSQYRDTPMDLADASLLATAESLSLRNVFTLDSGFLFYLLADGSVLEVVR